MPLSAGDRIGTYEVLSPIGAGGMGEVYRARDTRLDRDVALKVLPTLIAVNRDRLARFEREARTLAALNHPNIAQIYGIVDSPVGAGSPSIPALVMELVAGEDLADLVARGALPTGEAIRIATQIAEALEAAHERESLTATSSQPTSSSRRRVGQGARFRRRQGAGSRLRPTQTVTPHDATHDGVVWHRLGHVARAGARPARRHAARTSGRSAASSTRCSRGGGPFAERPRRTSVPRSSLPSLTGRPSPPLHRRVCGACSPACCRRT